MNAAQLVTSLQSTLGMCCHEYFTANLTTPLLETLLILATEQVVGIVKIRSLSLLMINSLTLYSTHYFGVPFLVN